MKREARRRESVISASVNLLVLTLQSFTTHRSITVFHNSACVRLVNDVENSMCVRGYTLSHPDNWFLKDTEYYHLFGYYFCVMLIIRYMWYIERHS